MSFDSLTDTDDELLDAWGKDITKMHEAEKSIRVHKYAVGDRVRIKYDYPAFKITAGAEAVVEKVYSPRGGIGIFIADSGLIIWFSPDELEPIVPANTLEDLQAEYTRLKNKENLAWKSAKQAKVNAKALEGVALDISDKTMAAWNKVAAFIKANEPNEKEVDDPFKDIDPFKDMTNAELVEFWQKTRSDYAMREALKEMVKRLSKDGENS